LGHDSKGARIALPAELAIRIFFWEWRSAQGSEASEPKI